LIHLEEARERLKHYADTIAHEIRTPLNRMLLNTEIALREKRSAADYEEIIEAQAQECSALSHLAQRLLFLARAESSDIVYAREALILAREFNVLRAYFEAGAADAGVTMKFAVENDDLTLHAERTLFQQAIGNLLTNAIAHTPPGGEINVSAGSSDSGVDVLVSDNGEGIDAAHLPHVFERFYRGCADGADRAGLGLAITKSIVEMHGGRISIESTPGAGVTIRMWWPHGSR
jgi:two-component system heavy metal sensor histidine kinase CusS